MCKVPRQSVIIESKMSKPHVYDCCQEKVGWHIYFVSRDDYRAGLSGVEVLLFLIVLMAFTFYCQQAKIESTFSNDCVLY